jgi:hypothetical protein
MGTTPPEPGSYREKLASIGFLAGGRTRPQVSEGKAEDGSRTKAVTDELDNTVTEHTRRGTGVSHRQDVLIRPPTIRVHGAIQED